MQPLFLHIMIAAVIGLVTYLVASRALAEQSGFGYPRLIAGAVSILGCIGLFRMGDKIMDAILMPSLALAIATCLVCALIGFRRLREGYPGVPSDVMTRTRGSKKKKAEKKITTLYHTSIKEQKPSDQIVHNPWKGR